MPTLRLSWRTTAAARDGRGVSFTSTTVTTTMTANKQRQSWRLWPVFAIKVACIFFPLAVLVALRPSVESEVITQFLFQLRSIVGI